MALPRLKPKTGQAGLYLLLLAIILGLMALIRWLPGKTRTPATRPFTIAMLCIPEAVKSDSIGLSGPGIEFVCRLESVINTKIRILPVADREAAVEALLSQSADIAGPIPYSEADTSVAFSEIALWKEFTACEPAAASHPAAIRAASDSITLPMRWAVRRSDTALLRTINKLLY